jgi:hypothetical protein
MGICVENRQPSVVTIPANAVVTLVLGDIDGNGLLKVRYQNQVLEIFATDLRSRGEPILVKSS